MVLAKLPGAGDAKTRLAEVLTPGRRQTLQAAFLDDALAKAATIGKTFLAFSPPEGVAEAADFGQVEAFPQAGASLGERMANALERALGRGYEPAILIGTDCPYLGPRHLRAAARLLRDADICLGPALDGGYYLVGVRRLHRGIFDGMAWGSPHTLAATVAQIVKLGLTYRLGPELPDVDTPADFEALVRDATGRGGRRLHSPRVRGLLASWYSDWQMP